MASPLAQVFTLSVILELLAIAAPFYMQITVDEVVARGDVDLMLALALGFGLLAAIKVATDALRSHIVLVVQSAVHFQMGARLFHHLVRLPLDFFEKRHIGDVLSRFQSIEPIRNVLAEGLILAAIDGIMAVATLAMIFVYSPRLALVVLTALLLYVAVRLALYRRFRDLSEAAIQAEAQENSNFIESARAIQSIKLFNREADREGQWLNRHADTVNANVRLGRAQIQFKTMNAAIFSAENIVTVYLAAMLALENAMTVGMVFAFMAYKMHFTGKASTLVEKALEFRLLDLHLERLSDIALTPMERGHDRPLAYSSPIQGGLELRNVSFRYAETERFVLENVNLKVEAGQVHHDHGPFGRRQDDAAEDHARAARADERRGAGRRHPAADHRGQGVPRADRRGDAGGPAALGVHRRQHLLLRPGLRPRADGHVRADGRRARRGHGDADGLQQPDRRHGELALGRAEAAGAARARACTRLRRSSSSTRGRRTSTSITRGRSTSASAASTSRASASPTGRR
jgi:hypothetical protein